MLEEIRAVKALLAHKGELVRTPMSDTPGYLTLAEAADYLHTPSATVRKWMRLKGLPYLKPGKLILFRQRDLDQWMNRYRQGLKGLALHGFNQ